MRVNFSSYVEAAGSSREDARRCLSPKTILDKIINFLTCGGRTRDSLKNLQLFQHCLYEKLAEHPLNQDIPPSLQFTFMDCNVTLTASSAGGTVIKVGESPAEECAELPISYRDVILKSKLKHETLAKAMNTQQNERANSTVINRHLKQHLAGMGFQERQYVDHTGNLAFSLSGNKVILLSTHSMVTWSNLKETCDHVQQQADEAGKTIVTAVGMINRPRLHEAHCVALVCQPGLTPIVIDSKSGPYPIGVKVINTGNQPFYDRNSCWAHAIQQCLHYTCQAELGISPDQLEPYVNE